MRPRPSEGVADARPPGAPRTGRRVTSAVAPRRVAGARARRRIARCALAVLGAAVPAIPASVRAQTGVATEGALFLLLPVGARAVGRGQAVVASVDGSEAVWWNPAGLARQEQREIAIHHSQPFFETTGDALTAVIPSSLLGVLALSANILDYGTEQQTDDQGNVIGTLTTRSFIFAASYATPIGDRLNAGITYKVLQFRVDCSGPCPASLGAAATSSAIDLGAQYDLKGLAPVTVGVALRNLGPSLQVNDRPQQDALPARLQLGVRWRPTMIERRSRELELGVSGDLIDRVQTRQPSFRIGTDATWRKRASLRGGYVFDGSEASGPAIGLGVKQGGLVVDVARVFGGLATAGGGEPIYLSLRYLF